MKMPVTLTVNGEEIAAEVEPRMHLADFVRQHLQLTGTHLGCEHGVCGACSIKVDGEVVRGCLTLVAQVSGARVETVEGVSRGGDIADLQAAFVEHNALQCGFCTPGMLLTCAELLAKCARPSRAEIREYLSGNICRCTGYHAIVDAVEDVVRKRTNR